MPKPDFKLRVPDDVAGLIRNLHPDLKKKVRAGLKCIVADPGSGKTLRGELKGLMSFRVSTFRVIYRVSSERIIDIVAIGPRKHIYEQTFRLLTGKRGK